MRSNKSQRIIFTQTHHFDMKLDKEQNRVLKAVWSCSLVYIIGYPFISWICGKADWKEAVILFAGGLCVAALMFVFYVLGSNRMNNLYTKKKDFYSRTIALRNTIDQHFLHYLLKEEGCFSYSEFLDGCLQTLCIRVCSSIKDGQLAVYGNHPQAYSTVLYIVEFYLPELVSSNYIRYYQTASKSADEINLGIPSLDNGPAYLPKETSSEIEQKLSQNIVVSPEFKEFVEAGHRSLELSEAKKTTRISVLALVFAGISSLVSIITLICSL